MNAPLLRPLVAAGSGVHLADQLVLAALPLLAVLALHASPATVGALVAAHGAAWLALTLPGGVWVDRAGPVATMRCALAASCVGIAAAIVAATASAGGPLAAAAFVSSAGTVLFVLSVVPAIREAVPEPSRAAANARVELARAAVTLVAPLAAGVLARAGAAIAALAVAFVAAAAALAVVRRMPAIVCAATAAGPREPFATAIRAGVRAVLDDPLLRAIAACAVLFNLAFFALVAIWVPHALGVLGLDAAGAGLAQAGYGAGLLAGAAAAPRLIARLPSRLLLVGGPGCAALAVALLWLAPGAASALAAQALVGFGPMVWQVQRTTLTQQRVPAALLGRASATIQLAVYGVRPLGAVAGGAIAQGWGTTAAIVATGAGFAASAAVMGFARPEGPRGTTIAA